MKRRIVYLTELTSFMERRNATGKMYQQPQVPGLILQLAQNGWEVDVFTPSAELHKTAISPINTAIRVIQIPLRATQKAACLVHHKSIDLFYSQLNNFISQENLEYQLIHSDIFTSGHIALKLKRSYNIPFVFTFRSFEYLSQPEGFENERLAHRKKIEQGITRGADVLIVTCPQDKTKLLHFYQASTKKTFVIPYGFNPNKFTAVDKLEARARLNLGAEDKVLVHVGSLTPDNGIDNIIKSLALLKAADQKIRLFLLSEANNQETGDRENERKRLMLLTQDLGLSELVSVVPVTATVGLQIYYSAADLFIDTPVYDGSGKRSLEAMTFGTPVIGSEVGAIQFAVVDGKTGFIVPPKAPQVLADRINLLLTNNALLEQMSRNSVKHIYSSFTWKKVAKQTIDLYEYILMIKAKKDMGSFSASIKTNIRPIPLRDAYLKRNMQPKYGN